MTKEELMDGMRALLDLLDAVPDGTDIISVALSAPYIHQDRRTVELHVSNNGGLPENSAFRWRRTATATRIW